MTERSPQPMGWLLVRRYQDASAALKIFEAARDLLFTQDLDASVLRFTLHGASHVAILGEEPLDDRASTIIGSLLDQSGTTTELPQQAIDKLRTRRRAFKSTGAHYLERRTQTSTDQQPPTP